MADSKADVDAANAPWAQHVATYSALSDDIHYIECSSDIVKNIRDHHTQYVENRVHSMWLMWIVATSVVFAGTLWFVNQWFSALFATIAIASGLTDAFVIPRNHFDAFEKITKHTTEMIENTNLLNTYATSQEYQHYCADMRALVLAVDRFKHRCTATPLHQIDSNADMLAEYRRYMCARSTLQTAPWHKSLRKIYDLQCVFEQVMRTVDITMAPFETLSVR